MQHTNASTPSGFASSIHDRFAIAASSINRNLHQILDRSVAASVFTIPSIHDLPQLSSMENSTREIHQHLDGVGKTPTNSAVEDGSSSTNNEDGLGSTSTGSTSINDGSIMNDLRNPGGSLFDTDSDSDSEPESNNTADEALEKHASTIYSDSGFKLIQSEIEEAVDNVTMVTVSNIGENEIYVVNDKFSKNWTVSYSTSFDSYACSCKMFGRNGLAVHCGFDDDIEAFIVVDEMKQEYRDMHGDFYDIARLIEGDGDKIRAFRQIMAEGRKEVLGEGNVLSISEKRLMIENFYGSHVPSQIDVHPLDVVKTKDCGRRLSRLEKEMR
ncbi:hypothetical protein SASPL_135142 [Salvia splendens]|uniref:Uncharacterized protein n=1 Tax=Salvia splendens TaxID=180675 RepID=A0A8X8ZFP0_SALSN|nr:hypothetical protein SASPL_135142 [Salvia splendens]